MTEPEEREHPTLEDEIFGAARPEGPAPDGLDPPEREPRSSMTSRLGPPAGDPVARTGSDGTAEAGRLRPPWESKQVPGCRDVGLTTAGFVTFVAIDSVMMYAPFRADDNGSLAPQMITLLVLAFGLGGLMVWQIRGAWRLVGIGLMLGWLFLTLISAGFLTGLNP